MNSSGLLTFVMFRFINKLMAIRRCPYCKAIIDESQKYCNNCGTQLLFPEDEFVEEDIKGDKIVDEDLKDEEEEFGKSLESREDEKEQKTEIDLDEVLEGGASFPGEEEKKEGDEVQEKEPEAEAEIVEKKEFTDEELEEIAKTPVIEEKKVQALTADELLEETEKEPEDEEDAEESEEKRAGTDTREEIARLIAALEKKHREAALSNEGKKILEPVAESSELPSWADLARETASSEIVEEEAGEKADEKSFAAGDTMDFKEEVMSRAEKMSSAPSTAGIPETVAKEEQEFHFDTEDKEREIPKVATEEIEKDVYEFEAPAFDPSGSPLGFFGRLTAVFFDLIFIAALWGVTVWLASRLMELPLKTLVTAASVPLGLFYLVLLVGYFFLFLFFLGETLGGRVVSPRD